MESNQQITRLLRPLHLPILLRREVGGERRNRTPRCYPTTVFGTACRPFSGALPWRREQGSNLRRYYPDSGLANRCLATRPPLHFELSDSDDELIRPSNLVGAEGFEPSKVAPKATVFASYTMPPKLWWGVQVSNLPLASEHGVTARSSRQCRSHPRKQKGRLFKGRPL